VFDGKTWGEHPHNHVCLASSSDAVRVRMRAEDRCDGGGVAGVGGGTIELQVWAATKAGPKPSLPAEVLA
jgi:hypothetical protein